MQIKQDNRLYRSQIKLMIRNPNQMRNGWWALRKVLDLLAAGFGFNPSIESCSSQLCRK